MLDSAAPAADQGESPRKPGKAITPRGGLPRLGPHRRTLLATAGIVGFFTIGVPALLRGITDQPRAPLGGPQRVATLPIGLEGQDSDNVRPNHNLLAVAPNGDVYCGHLGGRPLAWATHDGHLRVVYAGPSDGSVAVAADGTVFATDERVGSLWVIRNDQVTSQVPIVDGGLNVAVGPDGAAFVTTPDKVVKVHNDRVAWTLDLWTQPNPPGTRGIDAIAVAPDGTIYVAQDDAFAVTAIRDGRVVGRVNLGFRPSQLGITSAGRVYVAMRGTGCRVAVIDNLALTEVIQMSESECRTPRLAVAPDDTVYVAFDWSSGFQLSVVRGTVIESQAPLDLRRELPPMSLAVARDGTLYLATREEVWAMR